MKLKLTVEGLEVIDATPEEQRSVVKVYKTIHAGHYVPYSKQNASALMALIRDGIVDTDSGRTLVKYMENQAERRREFAGALLTLEGLLTDAFCGHMDGKRFGEVWKKGLTTRTPEDLAVVHQMLVRLMKHTESGGKKRGMQRWDRLLDYELQRLYRDILAPSELSADTIVRRLKQIAAFVEALPIYSVPK